MPLNDDGGSILRIFREYHAISRGCVIDGCTGGIRGKHDLRISSLNINTAAIGNKLDRCNRSRCIGIYQYNRICLTITDRINLDVAGQGIKCGPGFCIVSLPATAIDTVVNCGTLGRRFHRKFGTNGLILHTVGSHCDKAGDGVIHNGTA